MLDRINVSLLFGNVGLVSAELQDGVAMEKLFTLKRVYVALPSGINRP